MTQTTHETCPSKYSQDELNLLTQALVDNIEDVYEYFQTPYSQNQKSCLSRCFIHGGDNGSALNLYHNGDYRIHYKCRSHQCETYFGSSLISMIRGGLSHLKYQWRSPDDQKVSFVETIEFIKNFLDTSKTTVRPKMNQENHSFCSIIHYTQSDSTPHTVSLETYKGRVRIPSVYFINRGYNRTTLEKYNIGDCLTTNTLLASRAIVPVFDSTGTNVVGFSGRSVYDKCGLCSQYHDPDKPCYAFPKWKHSKNFQASHHLYNYHNALPYIRKYGTVVIVESVGNVWRLEEAGIHNAVAIFGVNLSREQRALLDSSGAMSIILGLDNDENQAGQMAAQKIQKQCERLYRVYVLNLFTNDISDMTVDAITSDIKPFLNQVISVYGEYV